MKPIILLLLVAFATSAQAQRVPTPCEKPEIPACASDQDVWENQDEFAICETDTEYVFKLIDDYRECLWEYRFDVIATIEYEQIRMVSEIAAFRQFSKCRTAWLMKQGLNHPCPLPDFMEK